MDFQVRHPADLGTAVTEFRVLKGLSQSDLARQVGLNRTYLSNVERGEVPLYVERLIALLDTLGLTVTISDS
jgi:transcriptional regulator with XRE-family HTH domain